MTQLITRTWSHFFRKPPTYECELPAAEAYTHEPLQSILGYLRRGDEFWQKAIVKRFDEAYEAMESYEEEEAYNPEAVNAAALAIDTIISRATQGYLYCTPADLKQLSHIKTEFSALGKEMSDAFLSKGTPSRRL